MCSRAAGEFGMLEGTLQSGRHKHQSSAIFNIPIKNVLYVHQYASVFDAKNSLPSI